MNLNGVVQDIEGQTQRLLVSLPKGKHPSNYTIELNYRTGAAEGYVSSIVLNDFSYLTSGDFSFTYEETEG